MRRENEGNATNKTIVTERRNKKAVACRFWTRARKYLEYFKNHDRKGKISDQDCFENMAEIFNGNKKNFIFTEALKIYYQAKSMEIALGALKLLMEAAKLD